MLQSACGSVDAVSEFCAYHIQESESMISLQGVGKMMSALLLLVSIL